jgi:hypothetical protein
VEKLKDELKAVYTALREAAEALAEAIESMEAVT